MLKYHSFSKIFLEFCLGSAPLTRFCYKILFCSPLKAKMFLSPFLQRRTRKFSELVFARLTPQAFIGRGGRASTDQTSAVPGRLLRQPWLQFTASPFSNGGHLEAGWPVLSHPETLAPRSLGCSLKCPPPWMCPLGSCLILHYAEEKETGRHWLGIILTSLLTLLPHEL